MTYKTALLIIAIAISSSSANSVSAQTSAQELGDRICTCLQKNDNGKSSEQRVVECRKLIHDDLAALPEGKRLKLIDEMDVYLRTSCGAFIQMTISDNNQNNGGWETLNYNPPTTLSDSLCFSVTAHKLLYYLTADGDTTYVKIADGFWQEITGKHKSEKTEKFKWLSGCDFELETLKASRYFKKGDKLQYRLIEQTGNYYLTTATLNGVTLQFKLYYE